MAERGAALRTTDSGKKKTSKPVRRAPRAKSPGNASSGALEAARRTLKLEGEGLGALRKALGDGLGPSFARAVSVVAEAKGRVIVSGIGKSGHIGQKIAATFASTGTPAFFVHPSEASHGDLGMITRDDVILAISWSGESVELSNIIAFSRRFSVPLVAITSRKKISTWRAVGCLS